MFVDVDCDYCDDDGGDDADVAGKCVDGEYSGDVDKACGGGGDF